MLSGENNPPVIESIFDKRSTFTGCLGSKGNLIEKDDGDE